MAILFRQLLIAVQFLTAFPICGNYVREEKDLGRSMLFYPVVGLLIGLITAGVYRLASVLFTPAVSMILASVAAILLTGGLHLDGFADMCDGFYAGKDKAGILAIMKDSHIGTMAVLGIFCLLLVKLSLLFSLLLKDMLLQSFLLAPVVSRWVMSVGAALYPYARSEGTAKSFVENTGLTEIIVSSLTALGIAYLVAGLAGIWICLLTLALALLFMQWVKKKIGGITGDVLGGLNEGSELCVLFLLNLAFHMAKRVWISG